MGCKGAKSDSRTHSEEMTWYVFLNRIPFHTQWFIPISFSDLRFSLVLLLFLLVIPISSALIPVLLVVSDQITNDR